MALIFSFVIALFSSSALTNTIEIEDWPQLDIAEHLTLEFPAACPGGSVGCTVVNLSARTCDVYLSPNWPMQQTLREHELEHCHGHDHMPFNLRAAHAAWVAAGKPDARLRQAPQDMEPEMHAMSKRSTEFTWHSPAQ